MRPTPGSTRPMRVLRLALLTGLTSITILGCNGPAETAKPDTVPEGPEGLFQLHCARCHAQPGQPGGPPAAARSRGPNLAQIGRKAGRDREYIEQFIRDPKSVDPGVSLMPAFSGKFTDEQIRSLAEYVLNLE